LSRASLRRRFVGLSLVGLAECAAAHGHPVRAARLSGASAVVLGSAGLTFHPFNIRPEFHERYVRMVRNQLGDEARGGWRLGRQKCRHLAFQPL